MKTLTSLLLALLFVFALSNCKKIKERKKTIINISVLNPITQEGSLYSGIPFELRKITEYKYKTNTNEIVYEGVTDSEGKATIEFNRVINHKKVKYNLIMKYELAGFTYSQFSSNYYRLSIAQGEINDAIFYVGQKVSLNKHIKNINCFDANDKAVYNVEKGIYTTTDIMKNIYNYDGCFDQTYGGDYFVEDYYPYTLTVTRNGQTTVIKDTFKIEQDMDTLKWYY